MKKTHYSWINSYFFNFWTTNFDADFDNLFAKLFALTTLNEVCNFNEKNRNSHVWIQKITPFKMANSPVRNVPVEKRDNENWSKLRWFSFQKIGLLFDHWNPVPNRSILRDIRGQNILPVINAIKRGQWARVTQPTAPASSIQHKVTITTVRREWGEDSWRPL